MVFPRKLHKNGSKERAILLLEYLESFQQAFYHWCIFTWLQQVLSCCSIACACWQNLTFFHTNETWKTSIKLNLKFSFWYLLLQNKAGKELKIHLDLTPLPLAGLPSSKADCSRSQTKPCTPWGTGHPQLLCGACFCVPHHYLSEEFATNI